MIFDSLAFFVFFPIVTGLYFVTPARLRWASLLVASWFFYAWWKVAYLPLLLVSTLVDFTVGRLLAREERPTRRKVILGTSLVVNLGMLFVFKYLHFATTTLHAVVPSVRVVDVVLPVGISFYTFQTIGYGIDVYRRKYEPETHLGRFALFVAFFPHLVAGPIMRARTLLPQFREAKTWSYDRAISGLGWMLWGLFKKVVIADRAAVFVDAVYGDPTSFQGATIILATYLFAFQIYCDFSGYSDIAVGAARVLGFELMENFERPYFAATPQEFWRRWHVSLSTWFFDYVYEPLGGGRAGTGRALANVAIVFLVSGLWHGASWTFVLWGAFHAVVMVVTVATGRALRRFSVVSSPITRALGTLATFHVVCFGWLLFRARDLDHVRVLLGQLTVAIPRSAIHELTHLRVGSPEFLAMDLRVLGASVIVMETVEWLRRRPGQARVSSNVRFVAYAALCAWVALTAVQTHTPFLYFQF